MNEKQNAFQAAKQVSQYIMQVMVWKHSLLLWDFYC